MRASDILNDFISLLRQAGQRHNFRCEPWILAIRRKSNNIVYLSGSINCLVYIKVRSAKPYRWGVTANRIEELKQSEMSWVIVLLHKTPHTGYLMTPNDVNRYVSTIWPLGSDGDYKVGPGSYLQFNRPFHSFSVFIDSLLEYVSSEKSSRL